MDDGNQNATDRSNKFNENQRVNPLAKGDGPPALRQARLQKRYNMPSSYEQIILHTTFSTKYRKPLVTTDIEKELYAVITASLRTLGSQVIAIGGVEDHIHIVHTLPRTRTVSQLLNAAKSQSSGWIRAQGERHATFEWQKGYAVFSADYRKLKGLVYYVRNQKEHHGSKANPISFRQEITTLLNAFGHDNFTPQYFLPDPPNPNQLNEPPTAYGKPADHRSRRKRFLTSRKGPEVRLL